MTITTQPPALQYNDMPNPNLMKSSTNQNNPNFSINAMAEQEIMDRKYKCMFKLSLSL